MFTHAFFDLDGTIYVDGKLIPNIKNSLLKLKGTGTKIYYMTNNTSVSISKYYDKLEFLGLPVDESCVISPTVTLANWMKSKKIDRFYSVGTNDFIEELCALTGAKHDSIEPEIVVVAFDSELTYEKLQKACGHVNNGIPWYITHVDLACPSGLGPIPDCGAIAKTVSSTTGIDYIDHFGKPSPMMVSLIKEISANSNHILVAGDRTYTDAQIGVNLGAKTVLVCTGEFQSNFESPFKSSEVEVVSTLADFIQRELS
ncbi:HAD-IIA family hydrolase [Vibrio vulnificus]|nr:HAD-IIA family hydrolase [Vibrio vulnificus]HDY8179563.1 HAD-IIA family hydrolase [Vibrio vulnificus]